MKFEEFLRADGEEQSRMVAAYETSLQLEAAISREAMKNSKPKSNRRR